MTAATREMTVSVQVLVVDGTRRMSHKFFDQIPTTTLVDDHGAPWQDGDDKDVTTVWGFVPDASTMSGGWVVGVDYRLGLARQRISAWGNETLRDAIEELPQLYLGG
jgi:hypothetical protein